MGAHPLPQSGCCSSVLLRARKEPASPPQLPARSCSLPSRGASARHRSSSHDLPAARTMQIWPLDLLTAWILVMSFHPMATAPWLPRGSCSRPSSLRLMAAATSFFLVDPRGCLPAVATSVVEIAQLVRTIQVGLCWQCLLKRLLGLWFWGFFWSRCKIEG